MTTSPPISYLTTPPLATDIFTVIIVIFTIIRQLIAMTLTVDFSTSNASSASACTPEAGRKFLSTRLSKYATNPLLLKNIICPMITLFCLYPESESTRRIQAYLKG